MGSDYVENASIDASNILKCAVMKFNPVAMLQSRITDYPF